VPPPRSLVTVLTSGDESVLALLPQLRAALNGSGPALRPTAEPSRSGTTETLTGPDDDETDPTAVAVTTSGSTGDPKTVLLPAAALLASASATHDRLGGAGRWLLALPAQHVAGVQVLVRSLVAGTTPVVLDLTAGFTPSSFAAAAARLSPGRRRYTALVPTQITRILDDGGAGLEALRSFDAVLAGGSASAPALLDRAAGAGVRVVTTYGMSETSGGCVYDGVPLEGVSVRVDGAGRVFLGGPTLARGYLGDPGSPAFRTDDAGQRWFRTDDGGVLTDGRLTVTGRLDAVIISGGVNVAPGPVEAALQRLPEVAEAVVVGLPDTEWGHRVSAALVLRPGAAAPSLASVRSLVAAQVSPAAAPRQLTVLDALPVRGPGKPDRAAITRLLVEQPPLEGL
jgi:o-succinylbenzoate---CoA ligase